LKEKVSMEEDVRYMEELWRWKQRITAARSNLPLAKENDLREWERDNPGRDISDWPGWETLIGEKPISGREARSIFRTERLEKIAADDTPVKLQHVPRIIVLMTPHKKQELDLVNGVDMETVGAHLAPMVAQYDKDTRPSLDVNEERIVSFTSGDKDIPSYAYSQLLPDGTIEIVRASYYDKDNHHIGLDYEADVVDAVRRALLLQETLGVEAPIAVTLSLIGTASCKLRDGSQPPVGKPIEANDIKGGEVVFNLHKPRSDSDVASLLRHSFNIVRRAGRIREL
jgi:hypothetical protein